MSFVEYVKESESVGVAGMSHRDRRQVVKNDCSGSCGWSEKRPVEGMTVGECRIISVKCLSCSETWVLLYRKEEVKETNSYLMHFCFVFRFAKTYLSSVWRVPVFDARPCFVALTEYQGIVTTSFQVLIYCT